MRFLVIRLSSVGDIVHALPAVAALGKTFPEAEIHWVVESRLAVLLEGNPFVRRILRLDTLGWRKQPLRAETFESIVRSILALREVTFDAAIDFQGLYKSGFIAWLSSSRQRVGFAEHWLREPGVSVFYTDRVSPRDRRHVIEMNLALVEHLGARVQGWQFPLPRTVDDDRYVEEQLAVLGAPQFILIHPGGGWKSKRWAPENYAELIRRLETEFPFQVLLTGSPDEEPLVRTIIERARSSRARYFPSTLVQFIALARRARLFVGGDTGPMHLASAVGTPVVALYGATDPLNTPDRNGPFGPADLTLSIAAPVDRNRSGKNVCYLQGISVESVLAAIHERLARANE